MRTIKAYTSSLRLEYLDWLFHTLAPFLLSSQPFLSTPALPTNPITDILTGPEPAVKWLIPHFLAQGCLVTLAGEPGHGKSYLSYYLGLALASGLPVLDFKTKPHRVVYFDQENSRPDRDQYLRWAWQGLDKPSTELLAQNFWPFHFHLGGRDWHVGKAKPAIERLQPHLIVFDTANPCFGVQDENDNAEASRHIENLRLLAELTSPPATILLLKHAKLLQAPGEPRTIRGAKSWLGAVDSVIYHVRPPGPPRADGLKGTILEPAKTRAFGLRQTVKIQAEWTDPLQTGLRLYRQT